MTLNLRIGLITIALLLLLIILWTLKKDCMPVKYSLIWVLSSMIIFLVGATPYVFVGFSKMLGFETMSNLIIGMFIFILLMITISLTVIASGQKKKITLLIQEVSILKEKIENGK